MKRCRFLLALPHEQGLPEHQTISQVMQIGDVIDRVPRLWLAKGSPIVSLGPHGCLIGYAFCAGAAGLHEFRPGEHERSAQELFRNLASGCWGAYSAVAFNASDRCWAIMVDPSGLSPVYWRKTATHTLLSSDPALLHLQGTGRPCISWNALHDFLQRPELRSRQTCLEGVHELVPGALTCLAPGTIDDLAIWQPGAFLPTANTQNFHLAVRSLRLAVIEVLGAWKRQFPSTAIAVSGGVDSSLICAALAAGGHDFDCVTMATADRSGDERDYARLLASHFGVRLEERIYDPANVDPYACASSGQPRPNRRHFVAAFDTLLADGAAALGRDTVWDGNGGDNLFCYLHSAAPVADRLRAMTDPLGTLRTLIDMCRVTGCDVSTMVRATIRRMSRAAQIEWPADTSFLRRDHAECSTFDPLTPWLDVDVGLHSGKLDHIALLMHAQNHVHGLGPGPNRFSPLFSQPLLELCLGIPTWLWGTRGCNRAVARTAFAAELPDSILSRTSKAGPDSFIRMTFDLYRSTFRELLLDGLLADERLLDRAEVEKAFETDTSHAGSTVYRLLDLVEAENWTRSWS